MGNKKDLVSERVVDADTAREYANSKGIAYFETSAKSGDGVDDLFTTFVGEVMSVIEQRQQNESTAAASPKYQEQKRDMHSCIIA